MMAADNASSQELTQSTMEFLKEKWRSAAWSVFVIAVLVLISLVLGKNMIAIGLLSGWIISLLNYILLAFLIDLIVKRYKKKGNKVITLLLTIGGYHGRFWALIFVLYYAFQLYGNGFGLAFLIGMSLLKWVAVCESLDRAFSEDF
ncbi:MAG: ATP synthase subunit I [Eubacteriales bacterium]